VYVRGMPNGKSAPQVLEAHRLSFAGDTVTAERLWSAAKVGMPNRSPVIHDDLLYHVIEGDSKAKTNPGLLVYKASDGSVVGTVDFTFKVGGHPNLAVTDSGLVVNWVEGGFAFFSFGEKPELKAQTRIQPAPCYAQPFYHEGRIFVRSMDALYCIDGK